MINPFETEQEELLALASVEHQFVKFSKSNLLSDDPDIFTKLKRNKIQKFSSMKQLSVKGQDGKKNSIMMNRNLFALLLVIAKSCNVNLKELLLCSFGTYPLSLSTTTGGLVKTAKSKFFDILEDKGFKETCSFVWGLSVYSLCAADFTCNNQNTYNPP
jgi:hypothetical protein